MVPILYSLVLIVVVGFVAVQFALARTERKVNEGMPEPAEPEPQHVHRRPALAHLRFRAVAVRHAALITVGITYAFAAFRPGEPAGPLLILGVGAVMIVWIFLIVLGNLTLIAARRGGLPGVERERYPSWKPTGWRRWLIWMLQVGVVLLVVLWIVEDDEALEAIAVGASLAFTFWGFEGLILFERSRRTRIVPLANPSEAPAPA